jgi:hypothetical protein
MILLYHSWAYTHGNQNQHTCTPLFIVALFIIDIYVINLGAHQQINGQRKCDTHTHTHTHTHRGVLFSHEE